MGLQATPTGRPLTGYILSDMGDAFFAGWDSCLKYLRQKGSI